MATIDQFLEAEAALNKFNTTLNSIQVNPSFCVKDVLSFHDLGNLINRKWDRIGNSYWEMDSKRLKEFTKSVHNFTKVINRFAKLTTKD